MNPDLGTRSNISLQIFLLYTYTLTYVNSFHPQVSNTDYSISEFGNIYCCKFGFESKINKRMTNSVDPDNRTTNSVDGDGATVSSGSVLFAKVSIFVCRDENVNYFKVRRLQFVRMTGLSMAAIATDWRLQK